MAIVTINIHSYKSDEMRVVCKSSGSTKWMEIHPGEQDVSIFFDSYADMLDFTGKVQASVFSLLARDNIAVTSTYRLDELRPNPSEPDAE